MIAATRRKTNLALGLLLPLAVLTGLAANTVGVDLAVDVTILHAVVAGAILLLSPWKSAVVRRGLGRRRPARWASLALLVVVLITLASGLTHATDLTDRLGPLTIMQVHVGGGFVALALVIVHYRSHPVRPRTADLERRAFLSAVGLGGVSVATWGAWEAMLGLARAPGAQRRFTGSHERSSYDPSGMPSTVWLDDRTPSIDPVSWHVDIGGRATTLADLAALPQDDVVAVLDCTGGWYSEQTWTGVRLDRLIEVGGHRSIEVHSVTGYSIRFPARDLAKLWLVTAAGGAPLRPGHGAPVRLVAPDRRGFWWVKWVDRVSTSDVPWWLQSPFPLT